MSSRFTAAALSSDDDEKPLIMHAASPATPLLPVRGGGFRQAVRQFFRENWVLLLLTLLVIVFGTVNRVLYKIMTVPMKHYPYFLSNFNSVCYTIMYFLILLGRYKLGAVTWDMLRYPKWKFILIGSMDSLGNVLGLIGAAHLSGPLVVLLPNGTILFTVVVSMIMLRSRYNLLQLLFAGIILGGIFLTILPKILGDQVEGALFVFYIIYFFSTAPNAVSFCTKELVFRERKDLDIFVVNSFGSLFQLCFTILFAPIVSIPGFGGVPFKQLPYYFACAAYCFAGINPTPQDDCTGSPLVPIIYIIVNLTWNICLLLLLKKGGAFYMFIAITASLPIAENLFSVNWPLLPATPFSWYHIGGLVVILSGIIGYRVATMRKEKKEREAEERRKAAQGVNADVPPPAERCPCITTDC